MLVCLRWADLCNAPPVLASLTVHIGQAANFLPRARSFFDWLPHQGAGKVQQLRLSLGTRLRQPNEVPPPALSSETVLELGMLLAAALPACAGSLRQLELSIDDLGGRLLPTGLWVPMLGSQLRRLVSGGGGLDCMFCAISLLLSEQRCGVACLRHGA